MTTPGVNIQTTLTADYNWWQTLSWVGTKTNVHYAAITVGNEILVCPETTNNPKRPDGTRAPSGWSKHWCKSQVAFVRPKFYQTIGRDKIYWEANGSVPLFVDFNVLKIYPGLQANWCLPGSGAPFPTDCRDLAKTKVLNKLASNRAQLGSALTEFRGSMDTVASAAEHITEGLSSIARSVRKAPRDIAGFLSGVRQAFTPSASLGHDITQLWLEKQYGLRPLIQDIQDAGSSLDQALFERNQSFLLAVRGGQLLKSRREVVFNGSIYPSYTGTVSFEVRTGCYFSAIYEIPRTGSRRFQEVGLSNAPAAFWEAVRLSWAVDHVLDCGSWLNSLMAADGVFFREGAESRIMTVWKPSAVYRIARQGNASVAEGIGSPTPEFSGGRFERLVLPKAGIMPAFLPSLKPRLGIEFASNALSVLSAMTYPSSGRRFK